jgi:DNA-binding NarL/FixJ family response regulator
MKRKVVIVDDHLLIAEALAGIIDKLRDFEVLYTAENGTVVMERFKKPQQIPDVVLLDIQMPLMDGFETAAWITRHHPEVHILALSMQDQEETIIRMVRSGARGYLLKNVHPADLELALQAITTKGYYYPDWVTHKVLLAATQEKNNATTIHINERELEFLTYAASDLTYKEIGDKMCCSPRTAEGYRDNLFEKLQVKSRVGLVLVALRQGLIKLT